MKPESQASEQKQERFFLLLSFFLVLVFFGPAWGRTFIFRDAFNLVYPYKAVATRYLRSFSICLWNPWETLGASFVGELAPGWFYPGNLLFALLPAEPGLRVFIVGHYLLGCWFMFRFLSELELSGPPAAAASLSYTLSGYVVSQHGMPDMLAACAWLPGSLWFLERLLKTRSLRWFALFSASLAMPFLAGRAEASAMNAAAAGTWLLLTPSLRTAKSRAGFLLGVFPAAGLFALALSMVQFLPSWELGKLSMKGQGFPLSIATLWSFHPRRLLEFLTPWPFGRFFPENTYRGWSYAGWEGHYPWSLTCYMGIVILFGCAAAAFRGSRRRRLLIFLFILFSFLLAFGRHFYLYPFLHRTFSFFRVFRYPEKYLVWAVFGIAAAGGWGIHRGLELLAKKRGKRLAAAAGLLLVLAVFLDLFRANRSAVPWADPEIYKFEPEALSIIRQYAEKNGLAFFGPEGRALPERFRVLREPMTPRPEWLSMVPGDYPFERYRRWERHTLMPNMNFIYGLEELTGYTAAATADFNRFMKTKLNLKSLKLFNTRFVISPAQGSVLEKEGLPLAGARWGHGFKVFYLPHAFPRAFLVGKSVRVKRAMDALSLFDELDFRKTVLLEEDPRLPPAQEEQEIPFTPCRILRASPLEVEVEAEAPAAAWLVLSDSFFPGWNAYLDGEKTPVFRANYLVRAVRVPPGAHRVAFRYEPRLYRTGKFISLVALLVFAFLVAAPALSFFD